MISWIIIIFIIIIIIIIIIIVIFFSWVVISLLAIRQRPFEQMLPIVVYLKYLFQ